LGPTFNIEIDMGLSDYFLKPNEEFFSHIMATGAWSILVKYTQCHIIVTIEQNKTYKKLLYI
jgi:hypothetical protein